jgi:hypothetical protein
MLATMADEIALSVAVEVESASLAAAQHRRLPDRRMHGLAAPLDVSRKPDVYRE